jgi:hypothetical protein
MIPTVVREFLTAFGGDVAYQFLFKNRAANAAGPVGPVDPKFKEVLDQAYALIKEGKHKEADEKIKTLPFGLGPGDEAIPFRDICDLIQGGKLDIKSVTDTLAYLKKFAPHQLSKFRQVYSAIPDKTERFNIWLTLSDPNATDEFKDNFMNLLGIHKESGSESLAAGTTKLKTYNKELEVELKAKQDRWKAYKPEPAKQDAVKSKDKGIVYTLKNLLSFKIFR